MKLIRSKPFIISLISTVAVGITYIIILACGGGYYWENDVSTTSFFQENVLPKNITFFGKGDTFEKSDNMNDFTEINVEEWSTYFDGKISKEILNKTLYSFDIQGIKELKNKYETSISAPNTNFSDILVAFKNIDKQKVSNFLEYLQYAKLCEPFATYNPYWYYESEENTERNDTIKTNEVLKIGKTLFAKCTNPFIKERYLFQLIRMDYFTQRIHECEYYFKTYASCFTKKTSMYWRSLAYYAGSIENKSRANYIFAQIFKDYAPLQSTAYNSFCPIEETDWNATIEYAQTNDEKINLWKLFSMYTKDYERCIQEVYAINPKSEILDELLLYGINNFELNNISFQKIESFSTDFTNLINSISEKANTLHPNFWNLAAGYINTINQNKEIAESFLKKVENSKTTDSTIIQQIQGIRIVGTLLSTDTISQEFENKFLPEFTWLLQKEQTNNNAISNITQWTKAYLAYKYFTQNEYIKSECLASSDMYYSDSEKLQLLIDFIHKPNKTGYEKLLVSCYSHSDENLYGLKAHDIFYNKHNPQKALEFYKKTDPITLTADPFIIHLTDCHDCDHLAFQNTTYNQVTLIEKIIELQKTAETNKAKAAEAYFLLGNAYYNITYYGNNRAMYESNIFWYNWGWENNYYFYSSNNYNMLYDYTFWEASNIANYDKTGLQKIPLDCSIAKEYYIQAMNASSDKEFKAKCCMMAAKCEYADFVNTGQITYEQYYIAGEFYKKMLKEFKKTKYFEEAIHECGYFRDFVEREK